MTISEIQCLIRQFPIALNAARIEPLGNAGGFSGARLWRLSTRSGTWCLRRWPKEYRRDQLEFVHQVLRYAGRQGCQIVPIPIAALDGSTYLARHGYLWELTEWLPGEASGEHAPVRVNAAMESLAKFHQDVADFGSVASLQPPPGLKQRLILSEQWRRGELDQLGDQITPGDWPELAPLAQQIIQLFRMGVDRVQRELRAASEISVAVQPCIRDIWKAHVLFQGDQVTGIVDFGATKIDHVATDIARLLGSMVGDDAERWEQGIATYETVRPLSVAERNLTEVYDRSSILLSGLNWLRWIYTDKRQFENRPEIIRRLTLIRNRLTAHKNAIG